MDWMFFVERVLTLRIIGFVVAIIKWPTGLARGGEMNQSVRWVPKLAVLAWLLGLVALAGAADGVLVEDWSAYPVGTHGLPTRWQRQSWGSPAYDFTIVDDDGRRALHLKSHDENSTITMDIKGKVNLQSTPILEWSWKAVTLPAGGDVRHGATDDEVLQVYVDWPRAPAMVRSRIIGYVWGRVAPVDTIVKSEKTRTVTYVVVRSGPAELGQWRTERRNVREDYKKIYGEEPENPGAISVAINTNNTHSTAEAFVGAIAFRQP
jgi:hypothetical protein